METEVIHVMFYNEVYVVALGPSVYLLITPAKARETYCVQSIHLRATPITESHALIVGINWKQRKYNLDCREVARGTQSAFSCLCSYSTFDIAKALQLTSVLCPKWPQVLEKVDV